MMWRRLIGSTVLMTAWLLAGGLLFGGLHAQEFEDEPFSGWYEEGRSEDSWFYDAYDTARRDDTWRDAPWYEDPPQYAGRYDNERDDDDWFYDARQEAA
jgi:hypothetical protein